MKVIYVEGSDNRLVALSTLFLEDNCVIYRGEGFAQNKERVGKIKKEELFRSILTNDEQFLDSYYSWDEKEDRHDLWFYLGGALILAQETTSKKLKSTHNLKDLYEAGEIGDRRKNSGAFIQKGIN